MKTLITRSNSVRALSRGFSPLSLLAVSLALGAETLHAQGPIAAGELRTGTIATPRETNTWTFTANLGDAIVVRMGKTDATSLVPWVRLFNPSGQLLAQDFRASAAEVAVRATNSGTFRIEISDGSAARTAIGAYRLTLAKTGSPIVVSSGDEGGPMTNGVIHTGVIESGDLDAWTINASAGETILVRMGQSAASTLFPWLRLYGPNGVLLDQDFRADAAEVTFRATNSGTFLLVVADANNSLAGTGNYRLTLAKTGDAVLVSSGDDGGPLTNGAVHTGFITPGDLDLWTISANAGDSFVVRMGQTDTNNLVPWLRLYGPNGALLVQDFRAAAAEVTFRATNNGTFLLVVSDANASRAGVGGYRLTLAKTGDPVVVSSGDEGGPLNNGAIHTGFISVGDLDAWTITATAGQTFVVRMGQTDASTLFPWLRLYGPTGILLDQDFRADAAEITVRATNNGTFLLVVADANNSLAGTGGYRLTLAQTGEPVTVSGGDDGGPLTNGAIHTGFISLGDLDLWTITANAGDALVMRAGQTDTNTLLPWLRLYGPSGALLVQDFRAATAELVFPATNTGTFLLVVSDANASRAGVGSYRLTLAKTGDPVVVSSGDDGGTMTNGITHTGAIVLGDLDAWTITANAGQTLVVRMGQTDTNSLFPWLRLYGPTGVLVAEDFRADAAEVAVRATNNGSFLLVAADGNNSLAGLGAYRLTLARTGEPVTISSGDEGGTMTNGAMHLATFSVGDLDAWTINANAGDSLVVRMGQTDTGSLLPWLRLYGPTGALLHEDFRANAAEVSFRATNSGVFLVVAADGNASRAGVGGYRITLARMAGSFILSPGDEGGLLNNSSNYSGTVSLGDLDLWAFTGCLGDNLVLRVEELVVDPNFSPWIRLYGRDGTLLASDVNATAARINLRAPANGVYTVVIGDGTPSLAGMGAYRFTAEGLYAGVRMCVPRRLGANLLFSGAGGTADANYVVFTSTDVTAPINLWSPIHTNRFGTFGEYDFSYVPDFREPGRFFRVCLP